MLSNILVPLDGSALAERALPVAEWLAHSTSGHLILVRAVQASTFPGDDAREAQVATDRLKKLESNMAAEFAVAKG